MKPTDIDTTPTAMARDGKPFVITVGREFGSGGRELARALADELVARAEAITAEAERLEADVLKTVESKI